ncbi:probable phosphatase 2C 12 isoform X1 [Olea europaea subsp. europaea]|uniref:Probable phosphatase 2C 12 isoform X1 n=1 Tax=Olea europaea subsp. europaea TaxID=158383 RepID=A0A8S0R559_OLEEU|nr:probable phosphatase 2C 12 isoform X1 [Olea europaea subsp. europaea]
MLSESGDHQTVPLSVLLKRELANEKLENPAILHDKMLSSHVRHIDEILALSHSVDDFKGRIRDKRR